MLYIYILIALFIAFIWLRYFRDIDIFEREQWFPMTLSFIFGAGAVPLYFFLDSIFLNQLPYSLTGVWHENLQYILFVNAGPEELVKVVAFGVSFIILRKHFNEPLDYLIYCSLGALGFSALENVLYFQTSGASIIVARGILSTVGHMFDTALFAYGIILYRFRYERRRPELVLLFFVFAVLAHTFYNFPLMYFNGQFQGALITIFYFLGTISIYVVILNNALNQSPFFDQWKFIHSGKVSSRLISSYFLLLLIQVGLTWYMEGGDVLNALLNFRAYLFTTGFIALISSLRLSRFTLIKGHWFPIKFEMPLGPRAKPNTPLEFPEAGFTIKGDAYDQSFIHRYHDTEARIRPMHRKKTQLEGDPMIKLVSRHFIEERYYVYKIELLEGEAKGTFGLIPKRSGKKHLSEDNHPILGLFKWDGFMEQGQLLTNILVEDLKINEWVVLLPEDHIDY